MNPNDHQPAQPPEPAPKQAVDPYHDSLLPSGVHRLLNGDAGLASTYWVWGVLAGIVWGAALAVAVPESPYHPDNDLFNVLKYSFVGYYALIYVAIWNAAGKYEGPKIWSILARFVVVLTCAPLAVAIVRQLQNH